MRITTRPEAAADAPAIAALIAEAFLRAAHTSHTEQHIVNALRATRALAISRVAESRGAIVAHVAASPVSVADGSPGWFGLGPLSVQPSLQRRGIGSQLAREALRLLRMQGAAGCVVLGDPDYYGRFGFRADPGMFLPGAPPEYFQVLPFGRTLPRGAVTYHQAFNATASDFKAHT